MSKSMSSRKKTMTSAKEPEVKYLCPYCNKEKSRSGFYVSTDPLVLTGLTTMCKECAETIGDKKRNLSFFFNQIGFHIEVNTMRVEDFDMKMNLLGHIVHFYKNRAHSPGGLLFTIDRYLITGDMLIKDLKTVTKLKWAKKEELPDCERWLREQQGKGYIVLAGHGDIFELDNYDINTIY